MSALEDNMLLIPDIISSLTVVVSQQFTIRMCAGERLPVKQMCGSVRSEVHNKTIKVNGITVL